MGRRGAAVGGGLGAQSALPAVAKATSPAWRASRRDEADRATRASRCQWCRRAARSPKETHFEPPRGKEPRRRKSSPASLPGARCGIPPGSTASRSALPHPDSPSSVSEEKSFEAPCLTLKA